MFHKKRKKRIASTIACLFTSILLITIIGNLLMLGFYEYGLSDTSIPRKHIIHMKDEISSHDIMPMQPLNEARQRKLMGEQNHDFPINHDQTIINLKEIPGITIEEIQNFLLQSKSCDDNLIFNETEDSLLGSGWTKAVYKGSLWKRQVAIKTVNRQGNEVTSCLLSSGDGNLSKLHCYNRAASKLLKEAFILQRLQHPNIIKVLQQCTRTSEALLPSDNRVTQDTASLIITELGEPLDIISLLQMTWEDRLRIVHGVTKLLHYLARTPYGSLVLNDFRRSQFVLVKGEIKLSDVDDIGFGDPLCDSHWDCVRPYESLNLTIRTSCDTGVCKNFNQKINMFNGGRFFITHLLPHGSPILLQPLVNNIVNHFKSPDVDIGLLSTSVQGLVDAFISGQYLNRTESSNSIIQGYEIYEHRDLPGEFDYSCSLTFGGSCTLSVFDIIEAVHLCDSQRHCRGFIMTQDRTWAGRIVTHFKNGFSTPTFNANTTLYKKI